MQEKNKEEEKECRGVGANKNGDEEEQREIVEVREQENRGVNKGKREICVGGRGRR